MTSSEAVAVRSAHARPVADAVVRFAAGHGVPARVLPSVVPGAELTAFVGEPSGGWVVLALPDGSDFAEPACRWLSAELDTTVSELGLFESTSWWHRVFDRGRDVDRYSSRPAGQVPFGASRAEAARVRKTWAGDPEEVAAVFGADPRMVARYYAGPGWLKRRRLVARLRGPSYQPRAFPDDNTDLLDGWVGADLWQRLGITYDPPRWAHCVGFDTIESPPFP
ncbi:hypothetical protein [Actinoplanes sp. NPDC051494]|uniref:hypothetical protein n=1 Tax=Actinoplanes sp. NPDC051494 TaxID=3363907 RepID=UPI0037AADF55